MGLQALAAAAALVLIAGAAAAEPAPARPPDSQPDQIEAVTYSWGQVIAQWSVHADGSGHYTATQPTNGDFNDRTATTRRWGPTAGRFDQVSKLLKAVEPYTRTGLRCSIEVTDGPYGEVSWRRHGVTTTFPVRFACRSPEADAVYDQIGAADALVHKWSAAGTADAAPASR